MKVVSALFYVILLLTLATGVEAQVTFSSPGASDVTINHCDDYFRTEWGTPLDMSDAGHGPLYDIPAQQNRQTSEYTYTNGKLSFSSTGSSPLLMFLQSTAIDLNFNIKGAIPVGTRYGQTHPIDSSKYRYFVARIYSDQDTTAQLIWSESIFRYAITPFSVYAGWHVYSIDLNNVTISTSAGSNIGWTQGSWEGLELIPTNVSGVALQFDYVQLVSGSCASQALAFTSATQGANNRFSLIVDDDLDPTNGVISRENLATGSTSSSVATNLFFPGSYRVYALQSGDWATLESGTPFDMSSSSQIMSSLTYGISNPTFSGGVFSGTTNNGDPSFYLKMPEGKTIPAATYNKISIGVTYTFPGGVSGNSLDVWFLPVGGSYHMVRANTVAGYQVLNITPPAGWTGDISTIRIDPANDTSGITFAIDFISFHSSSFGASVSTPTVQAATGSLDVTDLSLEMLQPDERGGRDYAQTVLGNAWLMDSPEDIATVSNVLSAETLPHAGLTDAQGNSVEGDFFRAYTIEGNGDPNYPNIFLINQNRIDTETFVNACFIGWNSTESNKFNSVARFIWHDADPVNGGFRDGDDVIIRRDNHEYCLDLKKGIHLEPPLADGAPNPWTSISDNNSSVDLVRVDMSESTEAGHYSVLDALTIRADHEANTQYAIAVAAPLTDSVALYYNTATSTTGGTLIAALAGGRNTNVYDWNTTSLANGTYYVYGVVSRDGDSLARLAKGRLVINHSLTQDTTAPILECERPEQGSTFDTYLEIAGYAMDETRLAALELFVDGTWIRNIERNKYHYAERQAYPNYADANTPGFQFTLDTTGYSTGSHTVRIVAKDTAGNQTSCDRSVTKAAGQNTALLAYPTPSNLAVSYPTPTPTVPSRPVVTPKLRVSIKQDTVTLNVSSLDSCSTFALAGSRSTNFASPTSLGIFSNQSTSVVLEAKKMISFKLKGIRTDKNNGRVHLKITCGARTSAVANLELAKVKSRTGTTSESAALSKFKKLLKVK